jgi:hypothetical protein
MAILLLAVLLFCLTAVWPKLLPPNRSVYQALFGASVLLGAIAITVGLAT